MKQFRKMRRFRQQLGDEACKKILRESTAGVLAVIGDGGYPYAVPLSYVYADGKIYFHSALQGHKVDAISANPKVSFCVIDKDDIVPQEFTTYFRSVIAFGNARIVEDGQEKMETLKLLAAKYSDASVTSVATENEIAKGFSHLLMIELNIEYLTGKESIELVRQGKQQ